MAFRLFSTAYDEQHAQRRAELEECLRQNTRFDEITVLAENCPRPEGFIGRWFEGIQRQRYADLLALAADADELDVVVIANADILIDGPAIALMEEHLQRGQVFALTRWDVIDEHANTQLFEMACSQDSWVFRGPPQQNIGGDYRFGVPGCDNRFAHELDAAGYEVLNPSKSIRTYHIHLSQVRHGNNPKNRVPLPYLFVRPHALGEKPIYQRPNKASRRESVFRK